MKDRKSKEKSLTVAEQYAFYLELVKLDEATMHPEQKKQVKQAFYAAWGQCLTLQLHTIGAMEDEDAGARILQAQFEEITQWMLSLTAPGGQTLN